MIKHVEYAKLLYDKIIYDKEYTVAAISRTTGTPQSTLYKYCEGILVVPVEFQSRLYNATGDIDFLNFTIDDTDKVLIDRHRGDGKKTVLEETLDVTAAVGQLAVLIQKAQGKRSESGIEISDSERHMISKQLNKIISEAEDVRALMEKRTEKNKKKQ